MVRTRGIVYQQLATKQQIIEASTLGDTSGTTSQSTYSIWIYIKDWSVNYGKKKTIFKRSNGQNTSLMVYLDMYNPTLNIQIGTENINYKTISGSYIANANTSVSNDSFYIQYSNSGDVLKTTCDTNTQCYAYSTVPSGNGKYVINKNIPANYPTSLTDYIFPTLDSSQSYSYKLQTPNNFFNCNVANIEIQKWLNIVFSINTNNIDVYINGDLKKSCNSIDGVIAIDNNTDVIISPDGGFSGWNSKFQYWPKYINPQEAMKIYSQGHGASDDENLKINISLYEGDTRRANLVI